MALRDHIAKLRAAKREEKVRSPDSSLLSPRSSVAAARTTSMEADYDDALTPWSHRDPFNQSTGGGADAQQKRVLKQRIEAGRTTGRLNIAALGLKDMPAEVLAMYDLASIGAYDGTWAESVDLTRLVAADNEFETIDNAVFPDRTAEEMMALMEEDEDAAAGNIFAGLEMLDLHGNLLISVPTGLRQLRLLTSLNLVS
jgi:hypothetical protein